MAERTRKVTREHWFHQLGLLSGKTRRRRRLRSEYFSLMGRISGLARERARLMWRVPYVGVVSRVIIGERISAIDRERELLLGDMRSIWYFPLPRLEEEIAAERAEIAEKIPPPPIEEQYVADEECTGMDLFYDLVDYRYIVRDPETRKKIRSEDKICMEITASITTSEGHDTPLAVEITTTCYVAEMDLSDLISTEKQVEKALIIWLHAQGWGSLVDKFEKIGVAYNSETHVEERLWYPWTVPDFPKAHVFVEKKQPRKRDYDGQFTVDVSVQKRLED